MSRYLAAFLAEDAKSRSCRSPIPDKSAKAKTPDTPAENTATNCGESGFRLSRDIRNQTPEEAHFSETEAMRTACAAREAALIGAFDDPYVAADRAAVAAELRLPTPGTPERDRLDTRQREVTRGLLLGFQTPDEMRPRRHPHTCPDRDNPSTLLCPDE